MCIMTGFKYTSVGKVQMGAARRLTGLNGHCWAESEPVAVAECTA